MSDRTKVLRYGSAAVLAALSAAAFAAPASAEPAAENGVSVCNNGGYLLESSVEDSDAITRRNAPMGAGNCTSFHPLADGSATVRFADGVGDGWFATFTVNDVSQWPCFTANGTIFNPSYSEGCS